ncbi:nucleotidyltransferase domain-containing protein [Microlunatus parietis]|uniref:Aminoglycoside-2''-adenylyltransferase n=1 Tax=Microlunatus parietis TaxID=682979 RepID=A0A7Y9I617_9ACTN|nr:hypothetical protein [Microlunatus parietis]NYE70938.1 hypothetical protein [Microlunatus parietis]
MTTSEPLPATPAESAETAYWARLYGRWESLDLAGLVQFMAGFKQPWWVVGGWAIDVFTGLPREHEDVDVSIFASDVSHLRAHVRGRWDLWNVAGGDMRPLTDRTPDVFDDASQIWVRENGDAPWVLDVPMTPGHGEQWTNKFIPGHTAPLEAVTWIADDKIRYLNPEIVLLFKARKRRRKDDRDFEVTWPLLGQEKQDWLREMIRGFDADHPWIRGAKAAARSGTG